MALRGPTQSRISRSILEYTTITVFSRLNHVCCYPEIGMCYLLASMEGTPSNGLTDFRTQGQNLALTGLCVPFWLDSGQQRWCRSTELGAWADITGNC